MMTPAEFILSKASKSLLVSFEDGAQYTYSWEFLRAYCDPDAEQKSQLPLLEEHTNISRLEPAGAEGLKLYFDDDDQAHTFSWDRLHELGQHYHQYWQNYLIQAANKSMPLMDFYEES